MKKESIERPVGDFWLERYLLGELPAGEMRRVEERLAAEPALRRRLEGLREQTLRFESNLPAEAMVPRIEAELAARQRGAGRSASPEPSALRPFFEALRPRPGYRMAAAFALLMLAALPVLWVAGPTVPADRVAAEATRLKGKEPELRVYRDAQEGPERVAPGASARPGDVIQLEFHPGGFGHAAILSVDGNGAVTLHRPRHADSGTALPAAGGYRLPDAFQLDAAPRFERFHLILSPRAIDLGKWSSLAARSAGEGEGWLASRAPESMRVVTFTLHKED